MKKQLIVIFDTNGDMHSLVVVDPDKPLPNGNYKVVKMLIGDYADDIYKELTSNT